MVPSSYEDIMAELHERTSRSKNVIITGLPEYENKNVTERKEIELKQVMTILHNIDENMPKPEKLIRLGKFKQGNHRPIKVFCPSRDMAVLILRNKNLIKTDAVKIFADRTLKQQTHLKLLKEELKVRSDNGEANLTIKYTNGVPKIVSQLPKNLIH